MDTNQTRRRTRPPLRSGHHGRRIRVAAWLAAQLVAGVVAGLAPATAATAGGPQPAPCPSEVATLANCHSGQDANGAYYLIAVPHDWNGSLVMHAHGGPSLGEATPQRTIGDLTRWSVMVREGYAWAGSSYRRGGYGARMAAADTEKLRRLYVETFGQPQHTFVHGQSWGGAVAAKVAEVYGGAYDGALLTNGVLAGGSRGYNYRVDLRVVYQYYCSNHPRPSEPQYPLWMGLRKDSTLTSAGLRARLQECTGYDSAPQDRTAEQQRNLDDIRAVTQIPERTLFSHLRFATFTFRDIVHHRLGGRNPFSNADVRYTGSHDDRALNAGVQRFTADPSAVRDLSYDSDVTGSVSIPVLTLHAADDPTAFVEHESAYRESLEGAGTAGNLAQTFTRESEHSVLSASEYATVISALATWASTGRRPTPRVVADACPGFDRVHGAGCFFDPGYTPASYESRVYPRQGTRHWPALTAAQAEAWGKRGDVGIAP